MNDFKKILTKLKQIISQQLQTDIKVFDKDVAQALSVKSTTLDSYKSRNKPPYKAILSYCHNNRLNITKILFDEYEPIIYYPVPELIQDDKVRIKYFRTLASYGKWLDSLNG